MTIDEQLLRNAIKAIEAEPKAWDQSTWGSLESLDLIKKLEPTKIENYWGAKLGIIPQGVTCGTSMCLAGHVVTQAGYPLLFDPEAGEASNCLDTITGERFEVMTKAQELLGVNALQAAKMFSGSAAHYTAEQFENEDYGDLDADPPKDNLDLFKANLNAWTGVIFE